MPRVFLAGLFHETNTFVESPTPSDAFQITRDGDMIASAGKDSPMEGFLSIAGEWGWEIIPGVDYRASPSGRLLDQVYADYWADFHPRLERALADGLDAIFLVLHGAMATENIPDVEGELLERIRSLPGAEKISIVAVLDLHANVSARMAVHANVLVPYRENPHIDARETAVRAARHLRRLLTEGHSPKTHYLHSRILLAPPSTGTSDAPMRPLEELARKLEADSGHWEVGIVPGFAHADTPDTGLAFLVVSDQSEESCRASLEALVTLAREEVSHLKSEEWELSQAMEFIARERKLPALLVEPADNIGGGAPGDATFVLRALLRGLPGPCGVILNDPETVESLRDCRPGEKVRVSVGGKGSRFDKGPVELKVTLERLTDGCFDLEDKQSHLASMMGSRIDMGPCAVLKRWPVTILVTSRATPPFDLGQWRSQGIEPTEFLVIGVKAAVGHRRAYDSMAASSFTVKTPGPCTSDLSSLPYRLLRRPIWPLDQ